MLNLTWIRYHAQCQADLENTGAMPSTHLKNMLEIMKGGQSFDENIKFHFDSFKYTEIGGFFHVAEACTKKLIN